MKDTFIFAAFAGLALVGGAMFLRRGVAAGASDGKLWRQRYEEQRLADASNSLNNRSTAVNHNPGNLSLDSLWVADDNYGSV